MSRQLTLFDRASIAGDLQFAEFYRECLRPMIGQRIKATDLRGAYLAWAEAKGRGSLSARKIAYLMDRRGHRRLRSNGVRYLDVELCSGGSLDVGSPLMAEAASMVLTAMGQQGERERLVRARLHDIVGQVDGLIDQLARLRRTIASEIDA